MSWEQLRLPALAPEAINIRAIHEGPAGWQVHIGVRRQLETWADVRHELYCSLSPGELVDVVYASLWCALGRPDDGL